MQDASLTDMVVFRENTEDIYAGIEWPAGSAEVHKLIAFLQNDLKATGIRFPASSGIGIKPVSKEGSQRLIRKAIQYAIDTDRTSVTLVHKGNIMKFTEGAFRNWGYQLAKEEFGAKELDGGPWLSFPNPLTGKAIVVKDVIADNFLQQVLLRPEEYDVIATLNLNGDYVSRRACSAGWRYWHRAGRQHRRRSGRVRGDSRDCSGLWRSRQSRLAHPFVGDDAALSEVDRSRGPDHQGCDQHHRQQRAYLRPGSAARSHQGA